MSFELRILEQGSTTSELNARHAVALEMRGELDERARLDLVFGPEVFQVTVCTKHLSRINSAGIRSWIVFFRRLRHMGLIVRFKNLSPAIVELNEWLPLVEPVELESVVMPLTCLSCAQDWRISVRKQHLAEDYARLEQCACRKCGGKLWLDVPRDYGLRA